MGEHKEVKVDDTAWKIQKAQAIAAATIENVEEVKRIIAEPGGMTTEKAMRALGASVAQQQRVREIVASRPPGAPVRERVVVVDGNGADVGHLPARACEPV